MMAHDTKAFTGIYIHPTIGRVPSEHECLQRNMCFSNTNRLSCGRGCAHNNTNKNY